MPLSSPYIRIEHRRDEVDLFLKANDYPLEWNEAMLAKTIIARLFDDDNATIGIVWAHWIDTGVLAFHVCIGRGYRVRWLDPQVIERLYMMAFWLGADEIVTSVDDVPNARQLRSMLLRFGFTEDHGEYGRDTIFTKNLWNPDGRSFQGAEGERPSGASSATGPGTD